MEESDQLALLAFARRSLYAYLEHRQLPVFEPAEYPALEIRAGVFVSVYVNDELRGCVGHIERDLPLYQVVQQMTIAAATRDLRFVPVQAGDLHRALLELSVLSAFTLIPNHTSIKIGVHGVMVQAGSRQGLLLPQVAISRNWTPEKFLEECCIKANLPRKAYTWEKTQISIFEAQIISEAPGKIV